MVIIERASRARTGLDEQTGQIRVVGVEQPMTRKMDFVRVAELREQLIGCASDQGEAAEARQLSRH